MQSKLCFFGITPGVFILTLSIQAQEQFAWPEGKKVVISLSCDDALDSQLDNALPSLNKKVSLIKLD